MPGSTDIINAEQERLQLLFRQARPTSIAAIVAAAASTVVIAAEVPGPGPWIWLGAILLFSALRLRLYQRFFYTQPGRYSDRYWLNRHAMTAAPLGLTAGSLPLLQLGGAPAYVQEMQTLIPALVVMATLTSYGVYFRQYLVLLLTTMLATIGTRLAVDGEAAIPTLVMLGLFAPILALTAKRYSESITSTLIARQRSDNLVQELTTANNDLAHQNDIFAQQQDLLDQEEELAKHVFEQLVVGGNRKLPGIHTWNQPMGSLSGDLIQTARGPDGSAYVFLGDFTGHGLPAALGALPASSVFLAMAVKGLAAEEIARELNRKLRTLLPVGYFCCAVLIQLSPDRRLARVWNGGLPPVLVKRRGMDDYEQIPSRSVPLGVVDDGDFITEGVDCRLEPGDSLYAYTDGLTEAEDVDGVMWGKDRLYNFLQRADLATPKLPALIDAVLEHVNLAPASDDISIVEIEVDHAKGEKADAA
jgi:serine phosphatase RsbU (regulator of sigma subunit)